MRSLRLRDGRWLARGRRAKAGSDLLPGGRALFCEFILHLIPKAVAKRSHLPGSGRREGQIKAFGGKLSFREFYHQSRPRSLFSDQDQLPYSLKAFRLRIDFPREYPLKPPTLRFTTKIYHPNVSEDGLVCLPLVSKDNWKPYRKIYQGRVGLAQERGRGRRGLLDQVVVGVL